MTTALLISCLYSYASDVKVILTGNTADFKSNTDEFFRAIENYCRSNTSTVVLVLNGDLFPADWEEDKIIQWREKAYHLLDQFPDLLIVINQGDRDWANTGKKGWKKIQSLESVFDKDIHPRLKLYFKQGCPGPWTLSISPILNLVILNSQWWNHPFEKPIPSNDVCSIADTDIFIEEFEGILDEPNNKNVMVLSHFPLESLGNYGGRFPVSTYLLPPLVGSARAGFHQNVGSSKDIGNENFDAFRHKLESVLLNYSSLIFASGHERNHSVMQSGKNFFINSGAPERGSFIAKDNRAAFKSSDPGFIEITYKENGDVTFNLLKDHKDAIDKGQEKILFQSLCAKAPTNVITNTRYQPCLKSEASNSNQSLIKGDTMAIAGNEYASGKFKERWLGKHYRDSWTAPVNVSYLNMDTTFQGLVVIGKGGGRQTTSLKLSGENGKEYVFRSVDKDPSKALGYELRGTIISEVLKDQTSTQQPYGAMAVSRLMDKIDVLHASPELYMLPKDDRLGVFKKEYGNLFGMLEERPNDKIEKKKIFGGADHIEKSFQLFEKIHHDHDNRIESKEFARARLFDLWIGDWSKHEDNWKWAGYKNEKGETFRPIPRDRDHAFSRWDGIIPWLADREWGMPNGENFDYKINGLRSLMWQARHLDRFVTSELTKEDWIKAAKELQNSFNEKIVGEAIKNMPNEIYQVDGREIESKLNARLKDLPYYAEQYYYMLAKEVEIVGSNKEEYFQIKRNQDGSVEVNVYDLNKKDETPVLSRQFYHRIFYQNETREIRLFGLKDNDVFQIEGNSNKSILIRIISGEGHDMVTDLSNVKGGSHQTLIYEKEKNTKIELGTEAKRIKPKDPAYYQYNRQAFKYNTYLPMLLLAYNQFTGASIQSGINITRQRFGKPDFSAKHKLTGSATSLGNFEFSYGNQFRHVIGKWDVISEAIVSRPLNYNYFFGVGNNTPNDKEKPKNYYRTQYNLASLSTGLTRNFWRKSSLSFVGSYEINKGIQKPNSYLNDHPEVFGIEKLHLFFAHAKLDLDFRDRASLAEHGFRLLVNQSAGHVQGAKQNVSTISQIEIENYFSTYAKNPVTFGFHLGAGTTHGDLPFYKLFSLGQLNNLQGFKRNRFTGQSKAFFNSELRWQLTETHNTFIPLKFGIRGFYDVGRVWADGDDSNANYWHYGYGGGFYLTPFTEQFALNVSAGSSKEESVLLMISVGSFFR